MQKKTDLRIIKTQNAIYTAFMALLSAKKYEDITVLDIAKEAVINRNTFYLHFKDKDDLYEFMSNQCFNELNGYLNKELSEPMELNKDSFLVFADQVFQAIESNIGFYRVMMGENGLTSFSEQFKTILQTHIRKGLKQLDTMSMEELRKQELLIEYLVTGFIGVIRLWLQHPDLYSVEMASWTMFLIHSNSMELLLQNHK